MIPLLNNCPEQDRAYIPQGPSRKATGIIDPNVGLKKKP